MHDDTDGDFFQIPRLRGILRMLLHLRIERRKDQDRGDTIMSVAAVLSDVGRTCTVISRQHHDEWSVTSRPLTLAPHPAPNNSASTMGCDTSLR